MTTPSRPLLRQEENLADESWDDPVRGRLGFRTLFSGDETATRSLTSGVALLPVGGWLGLHRHAPTETYYVLDGEGLVTLDGVEHTIVPGTAVQIPSDIEHGVRNTGETPLRFVYVFAADSMAQVEYRFTAH